MPRQRSTGSGTAGKAGTAKNSKAGTANKAGTRGRTGTARKAGSARTDNGAGSSGHHALIAQPYTGADGPLADSEAAAGRARTSSQPLGAAGEPLDRRSPFFIGVGAAAGVTLVVAVIAMIVTVRSDLVLIGLALFLALGLEPAVSWLARSWMPRWTAVLTVCLGVLVAVGGFLTLALTPLLGQASAFATQAPQYVRRLQENSPLLAGLNSRFHLQQSVEQWLTAHQSSLAQTALGVGATVFTGLLDTLIVVVLTVYFLAAMPGLRVGLYRMIPRSRRPRAILLGDAIMLRFGGYVLGSLVCALTAGVATFAWLSITGVPFPLALALLTALLDLLPVVGSSIAGVLISLMALTVSVPTALATAAFFLVYRCFEDYLIFPRVFGKVLRVPGVVMLVALLLGAGLAGIVGAIVSIPIAAALLLVVQEVAYPRLEQM